MSDKGCCFCDNACINSKLTDENDYSSTCIGKCVKGYRFMLSSGYGKPVRIELEYFNDNFQRWLTYGYYFPKYCPECGRKLDEYEVK